MITLQQFNELAIHGRLVELRSRLAPLIARQHEATRRGDTKAAIDLAHQIEAIRDQINALRHNESVDLDEWSTRGIKDPAQRLATHAELTKKDADRAEKKSERYETKSDRAAERMIQLRRLSKNPSANSSERRKYAYRAYGAEAKFDALRRRSRDEMNKADKYITRHQSLTIPSTDRAERSLTQHAIEGMKRTMGGGLSPRQRKKAIADKRAFDRRASELLKQAKETSKGSVLALQRMYADLLRTVEKLPPDTTQHIAKSRIAASHNESVDLGEWSTRGMEPGERKAELARLSGTQAAGYADTARAAARSGDKRTMGRNLGLRDRARVRAKVLGVDDPLPPKTSNAKRAARLARRLKKAEDKMSASIGKTMGSGRTKRSRSVEGSWKEPTKRTNRMAGMKTASERRRAAESAPTTHI